MELSRKKSGKYVSLAIVSLSTLSVSLSSEYQSSSVPIFSQALAQEFVVMFPQYEWDPDKYRQ